MQLYDKIQELAEDCGTGLFGVSDLIQAQEFIL
jgi:hypothetical protein